MKTTFLCLKDASTERKEAWGYMLSFVLCPSCARACVCKRDKEKERAPREARILAAVKEFSRVLLSLSPLKVIHPHITAPVLLRFPCGMNARAPFWGRAQKWSISPPHVKRFHSLHNLYAAELDTPLFVLRRSKRSGLACHWQCRWRTVVIGGDIFSHRVSKI